MSDMTNYLETQLRDEIFAGSNFSPPSAIYVALFTADPGETGSTTNEVSDSGYSRQDAAAGGAVGDGWNNVSDGKVDNAKKLEFGAISDSSVTVSHMALMDASTGGNMLFYGPIEDSNGNSVSRTLEVGDKLVFEVGDLDVELK